MCLHFFPVRIEFIFFGSASSCARLFSFAFVSFAALIELNVFDRNRIYENQQKKKEKNTNEKKHRACQENNAKIYYFLLVVFGVLARAVLFHTPAQYIDE